MSKSGSDSIATAWSRLQALSCRHAAQIHRASYGPVNNAHRSRYMSSIGVPEVIQENVGILGRGDEAELKNRVFWYIMFHPAIFNECSKAGWNR